MFWTFIMFDFVLVFHRGPQLSRQNQKPHCKNKIPHGNTENLTAKPKTSRQKQNTSRQHRKPHGKTKNLTAKTKYLTAKPKTSNLVLPWGFCFCLEVFGFAVTVVGHHSFCIKFEKNLPFVFQVTIYRMWAEAKSAFVSRFLYTSDLSRWFPKM